MQMSVADVATVLGKSPRQVRYMIRQGQLKAVREGKSWRIDGDSLPLGDAEREALSERVDVARETFDAALEPVVNAVDKAVEKVVDEAGSSGGPEGGKKGEATERYSVRKLLAFETARGIYRELATGEAANEPAKAALFQAIVQLTQGCHAFRPDEKATHFREARGQVAAAIAHLYVGEGDCGDGDRGDELAARLEQELIPKIGGLVAVHEKGRKKSSRFERFGTSKPRTKKR